MFSFSVFLSSTCICSWVDRISEGCDAWQATAKMVQPCIFLTKCHDFAVNCAISPRNCVLHAFFFTHHYTIINKSFHFIFTQNRQPPIRPWIKRLRCTALRCFPKCPTAKSDQPCPSDCSNRQTNITWSTPLATEWYFPQCRFHYINYGHTVSIIDDYCCSISMSLCLLFKTNW